MAQAIESTKEQDATLKGIEEGISTQEIFDTLAGYEMFYEQADLAHRVHDGDGLSPSMKRYLQEKGKPQLSINLTRPLILSVRGHAIDLTTDILAQADDDEGKEVAEAMNQEVHEAVRMSKMNDSFEAGLTDTLVGGLGWAEVRREGDPMRYGITSNYLNWREMKCDMSNLKAGNKGIRWWARERLVRADILKQHFKNHTDLIDRLPNNDHAGWRNVQNDELNNQQYGVDRNMRYITIREVYERTLEKTKLIRYQDGRVEEFSPDRMSNEVGQTFEASINKIKKSYFLGSTKVFYADYEQPNCPFIPIIGYINDEFGYPQGPVADMISAQWSYNKAHNEMHHILDSVKIKVREGALDPKMNRERVIREASRRDSYFKIKAEMNGRSIDDALQISTDWQGLVGLQELKEKSEQEMHTGSGILPSYTGKGGDGVKSGVAITAMAELGSGNMRVIQKHFRNAKMVGGELVMGFIVTDKADQPFDVSVKGEAGAEAKIVHINQPGEDGHITNHLMMTKMHISMASMKTSAAYRGQQLERIESVLSKMVDPQERRVMMTLYLKASNMPGAEAALEQLNALGGGGDPEAQQAAEQQAQEMMMAEQKALMDMKMLELEQEKVKLEQEKVKLQQMQAEIGIKAQEAEIGVRKAQSDEDKAKFDMLSKWQDQAATRNEKVH